MNNLSEFEVGVMTIECGRRGASVGIQCVSRTQSTDRDDATDERRERLLRLKAEIEGGVYFVSANDLAERLMNSMLRNGAARTRGNFVH